MGEVNRGAFPMGNRCASRGLRARPLALCLLAIAGFGRPFCRAADLTEYQVKAAYLLNFTKFIEWPAASFASPDSPIEICILGEDPFGIALDQIVSGEKVNGRRVTAQRIGGAAVPKTCAVVFVSRPDKEMLKQLPNFGPGILTVGDGQAFLRNGGMIGFVMVNRHVRFEINRKAADLAGLKLSSKLLNVAVAVE